MTLRAHKDVRLSFMALQFVLNTTNSKFAKNLIVYKAVGMMPMEVQKRYELYRNGQNKGIILYSKMYA